MEERITIARPYAEAAHQQAQVEQDSKAWSEALKLLSELMDVEEMKLIVQHPKVSPDQVVDLILDMGKELFTETRANFVRILSENKRLAYASEISGLFESFSSEDEGKLDMEIISAYPLDKKAEESIADAIKQKLEKKISLKSTVDESLIGGAVIRAGDWVIDSSMRGRLDQLSNTLRI